MRASKTWLFLRDVLLQRALARRHLRQLGDALADVEEVLKRSRRYQMNRSITEALILKSICFSKLQPEAAELAWREADALIATADYNPVALPPHC